MKGRIPQGFIDDLLSRVDIVDVVSSRINLKKSGKNYSACCPFHDEKTPSFTVSPQKQFYYCFGCGASGNAVGFAMEFDNTDFPQTVETLAQSAGLEVPRESKEVDQRELARKQLFNALDKSARFYRFHLQQDPNAIAYLRNRGLSGKIAQRFSLGYAPQGWDTLITLFGNTHKKLLLDAGMLVDNQERGRQYDRFRDRIMFPIRDTRGRTIAFGGRVFGDEKPKYLNSPETLVFHKSRELYGLYECLQSTNSPNWIMVVEGYMDVVALAQYGINTAVATLGTSVGEKHIEKLFKHSSEIIFCFDGDEAGRKAASRALEACLPLVLDGRRAKFLFLSEGEDPDSLVQKLGKEKFEEELKKAMPLSAFLFQKASQGANLQSPDAKAEFAFNIKPLLALIPESVFKQACIRSLADQAGLHEDDLRPSESEQAIAHKQREQKNAAEYKNTQQQLSQATSIIAPNDSLHPEEPYHTNSDNIPNSYSDTSPTDQVNSRLVLSARKQLIALIIEDTDLARNCSELSPDVIGTETDGQILLELVALLKKHPSMCTAGLLGYWSARGGPHRDILGKISQSVIVAPSSQEKRHAEFKEILDRLQQKETETELRQRIKIIGQTPYDQRDSQLKQEERELQQKLRQLLQGKSKKNKL